MQVGQGDGRVCPRSRVGGVEGGLMVTGKQGGAERPRAVARVCAGSAGQSAQRGEHIGELCKQQEA